VTDPELPSPDDSLERWLDAIAAASATPAGGSAAAIASALAAALGEMVAGLTLARERYASVQDRAADARSRARVLREELLGLAARDAQVFSGFMRALALPRTSEVERGARDAAKHAALRRAAEVQLDLLDRAAEIAELAVEMADSGLGSAVGDAATGVFLAAGAARSAYWSVHSDLGPGRPAEDPSHRRARMLLARAEAAERRVSELLGERLG
jgi:glutamate formiminotransferase/formiminotetrahydrofolate cyclodeaminase